MCQWRTFRNFKKNLVKEVLLLRIPFWKATVSQNMKAFKLQFKFCETKDWSNPYYD